MGFNLFNSQIWQYRINMKYFYAVLVSAIPVLVCVLYNVIIVRRSISSINAIIGKKF